MAFFVVLLNFVTLILAILAFSPLSEMRKVGWDYIFYAFITSSLATIIYFFISASGLRDVVVILIGAYILFEVRERYS
jgi:Na+/H+-dicarboxylate symporter